MDRTTLMTTIAKAGGISNATADRWISTVLDGIQSVVTEHKQLHLRGFGVFKTFKRNACVGRNPTTGEVIPIPECSRISFKPGKTIKSAINNSRARG